MTGPADAAGTADVEFDADGCCEWPRTGQVLDVDQVVNDPVEFSMAVAKAGHDPEVALELLDHYAGELVVARPSSPSGSLTTAASG